jgi:hypothetical protein
MIRLLFAVVLFAITQAVEAQPPSDSTVSLIGPYDNFTTDELGNVYAVKGDVLELYDPQGRRLAGNSVKTFGRITVIDAFYSLKPVIFSSEQRQLAVLDNTLTVQGSVIDLPRNDWPWVSQVCASVQNGFWFFDERELSLTRVDAQLKALASTGRLDQLLGHSPRPSQLVESDGLLYVVEPASGVHVFDLFGAYLRTLPIVGATRIQVRGGSVFSVHDVTFWRYDPLALEERAAIIPGSVRWDDVRIDHEHTYFFSAGGIRIAPTARR